MKFFKFLVIVLLIPPFIYSGMLVASSLKRLDWGTVPDWFSFLANAFTVLVTLLIAKRAKKFLDEKVHSEGLTRGYKIMDAIDELNDTLPSFVYRTIRNHEIVRIASRPLDNHEGYSLDHAIKSANIIRRECIEYSQKIKVIRNMLKRLGRWHIEIAHPDEFSNFLNHSSELLENTIYISGYNAEHNYPDSSYGYTEANERLSSLKSLLVNIESSYDEILSLKFKETFKET